MNGYFSLKSEEKWNFLSNGRTREARTNENKRY